MPIVPSGKRRLMKLQQQYQVTDQDADATQSEVTGGGDDAQGPAFDTEKLKQNMSGNKPGSMTGPQYGEDDFEAAASGGRIDPSQGEEKGQSDEELGKKGANIRGFVFQMLEQLGAPPRLIIENPDTFFQGKKDLDTGTISGSYVLPSYTRNRKIEQAEAEQIAMKIGERFGLSQSISPQGNNFKVDFRTREVMTGEDHGTSLQELVKNKGGGKGQMGGGQSGGQPGQMARAARTQSEMIKGSGTELYERLREMGFGGK